QFCDMIWIYLPLCSTGTNHVSSEATDPALRKIEKAAIVDSTYGNRFFLDQILNELNYSVHYSPTELLFLIRDHLIHHGLHKTADTLLAEAVTRLFFEMY